MGIIVLGANTPLNQQPQGTVPDVSGALQDRFQNMTFEQVTKTQVGFQVVETTTPISFFGNIQPFTERQLLLLPIGERAWSWYWLQSTTAIDLKVDDVVIDAMGRQYRIASKKNQTLAGFLEWKLVQDWTGSGPTT